jgi:hypothetical protein
LNLWKTLWEKGSKEVKKGAWLWKSLVQKEVGISSEPLSTGFARYKQVFHRDFPTGKPCCRKGKNRFSPGLDEANQHNQSMSNEWVEGILRRYNLWENFKEQEVLLVWDTIVGERIARLAQAKRFSKGTLLVAVSSSTVAHELSFLKTHYIAAINEKLGASLVQEIHFVPSRFGKAAIAKPVQALLPADYQDAQRLFSHLEDPALRTTFERLYISVRQREERLLASGARRCMRCGVVFREAGEVCPGCRFSEIEAKRTKG